MKLENQIVYMHKTIKCIQVDFMLSMLHIVILYVAHIMYE